MTNVSAHVPVEPVVALVGAEGFGSAGSEAPFDEQDWRRACTGSVVYFWQAERIGERGQGCDGAQAPVASTSARSPPAV